MKSIRKLDEDTRLDELSMHLDFLIQLELAEDDHLRKQHTCVRKLWYTVQMFHYRRCLSSVLYETLRISLEEIQDFIGAELFDELLEITMPTMEEQAHIIKLLYGQLSTIESFSDPWEQVLFTNKINHEKDQFELFKLFVFGTNFTWKCWDRFRKMNSVDTLYTALTVENLDILPDL